MKSVIRGGERYLVGQVGPEFVWAKRSYFAERFSDPKAARAYVRNNIDSFRVDIDAMRIVNLRPRPAR